MISPRCTHDIPRCSHGIPPMYSWYPSDVLMVSPRCTHGIPPMYSWYPPDVLMVSPRCTEHTLYRVVISTNRFSHTYFQSCILATFVNRHVDINFNALVPCAFFKLGLRTMNTSSCTAHTTIIIANTSLTVSRMLLT